MMGSLSRFDRAVATAGEILPSIAFEADAGQPFCRS